MSASASSPRRSVAYWVVTLLVLLLSCHAALAQPPRGPTNSTCLLCSSVVGDPAFSGLRGQQYQVHGIDGGIYNLISQPSLQLNSKFAFLSGPRPCPVLPSTGRRSSACFSHDGSYLGNLALRTNKDDRLLVEAGDAASGFARVEVNGVPLLVGDLAPLQFADGVIGTVHRSSSHELSIVASLYELEVDNSDAFLNLRSLAIRGGQWSALVEVAPHGLLGQTWQVKAKSEGVIDGVVDDYMLEDGVFGSAFIYNRFVLAPLSDRQ